tara:strand:+ start:1339 stop:2079 length:741 start_codon:yes stop_codon:yes gene_type:complete
LAWILLLYLVVDINLDFSVMRYLYIFLTLFLVVGCGESQYERCLKVEKAKVVENWDDIYQIAKRLVLSFGFPLDFRGVLDAEMTSTQDIQKLRDSLQTLAGFPHTEMKTRRSEISEMEKREFEETALQVEVDNHYIDLEEKVRKFEADATEIIESWDHYMEIASDSLAEDDYSRINSRIGKVIDSDKVNSDDFLDWTYFGIADEVILAVQYEVLDEIEKANQEGMERLASVQNEIAANICNSRGLY